MENNVGKRLLKGAFLKFGVALALVLVYSLFHGTYLILFTLASFVITLLAVLIPAVITFLIYRRWFVKYGKDKSYEPKAYGESAKTNMILSIIINAIFAVVAIFASVFSAVTPLALYFVCIVISVAATCVVEYLLYHTDAFMPK